MHEAVSHPWHHKKKKKEKKNTREFLGKPCAKHQSSLSRCDEIMECRAARKEGCSSRSQACSCSGSDPCVSPEKYPMCFQKRGHWTQRDHSKLNWVTLWLTALRSPCRLSLKGRLSSSIREVKLDRVGLSMNSWAAVSWILMIGFTIDINWFELNRLTLAKVHGS